MINITLVIWFSLNFLTDYHFGDIMTPLTERRRTMEKRMKESYPETNLKRIRTAYGCTQAELAEKAGVSLRSIQMYEQRNKDINRASAESLYRIAKVLGCSMEDLIEQ